MPPGIPYCEVTRNPGPLFRLMYSGQVFRATILNWTFSTSATCNAPPTAL